MKLSPSITQEIDRIAALHQIDPVVLKEFAQFVLKPPKPSKPPVVKPLTLTQLKAKVFDHFGVADVKELKKSAEFVMGTNGLAIKLTGKEGWETLYRKFVGVLPNENAETGPGCINGINIFKYSLPWRVFGLDPATATTEDIKTAYRNLSKIYHPDAQETGDAKVFERLTQFYNSLTERF